MTLTVESIRYGNNDEFSGFLAHPTRAKLPLPGVVVIQEAWGLDDHIEDVTRRIALAGYAAFAPDVYAREGERPAALTRERASHLRALFDELKDQAMDPEKREAAIAVKPEPLRTHLRESLQALYANIGNSAANLPPVLAAAKYLRERCPASRGQKVGSVGFCMGGGLSALLAANDSELSGAIVFYGMAPSEDQVANIRCPVLGLYGAIDDRVNAGIPGLVEAMKKHGKSFEHHVYEGARHAFFNDSRPTYDARAARDAFARTLVFFRDNLT